MIDGNWLTGTQSIWLWWPEVAYLFGVGIGFWLGWMRWKRGK